MRAHGGRAPRYGTPPKTAHGGRAPRYGTPRTDGYLRGLVAVLDNSNAKGTLAFMPLFLGLRPLPPATTGGYLRGLVAVLDNPNAKGTLAFMRRFMGAMPLAPTTTAQGGIGCE